MKNKVLTEIYIPQIDENFDIYLPLNKNIATVITLVCKSIMEIKRINIEDYDTYSLYNRETALKYPPDSLIKNTNIRNGFRLIIM